ncbi:MAG: hypothetical protein EX271_00650 [Acidimicrobiales bacterium]|nr:hypothetical protein [Hyphomonadaceae bacterium]RZV44917.1 MAG: hypothetical protein EX271_00650 [Acidimicrobiales bacterium]
MRKILLTAVIMAVPLSACIEGRDIEVGDASGLSPSVLKKIDVSDRQSILFGHYEHLSTVSGRTFEGCCVYDANRLELANYAVKLFENSTGDSFDNMEMLIGAVDNNIWIYFVPKSTIPNPRAKTYVLELDQNTGEVISFKLLANSLKKS